MYGRFIVCIGDDEVVAFVDPHLAWCFGQYVSRSGGFWSEFGVAGDDEVGGRGLFCHDVADPAQMRASKRKRLARLLNRHFTERIRSSSQSCWLLMTANPPPPSPRPPSSRPG